MQNMKRSLSLLKPDKCKMGLSFITDSLLCFHWEPNLTAHQKATACCLYFHSFREKIKINKDASMFLRKVLIEREEHGVVSTDIRLRASGSVCEGAW